MNYLPQLASGQKSVLNTTTFAGYNHNEIIADGEMYNTENLSGRMYPALTVRKKRGIMSLDPEGQEAVPLTGIHGRDQLVFVRGQEVFYNLAKVNGLQVSADERMCPKKIVSMGAYTCIWPDKVYFNTVDLTDCGDMERRMEIAGETVDLIMCRGDGTNYDMTSIHPGITPPEDPVNGTLWLDQSGENDVLKQYSANDMGWVEVATTYVKIGGTGIGHGLKEYDAITISGLSTPDQEAGETEDLRLKKQVDALNGSYIVYAAGENYIVVAGLIYKAVSAGGLKAQTVHADRTVPDLDYICESNNRLWGCKYGLENGVVVNEIRASKLGDFRNWACFMGLSTDSYTASIGSDGAFTGAISQRGYPIFFKEGAIHRVTGNTPSSFSIQTTAARGVQSGSWRSLAIVNENIYYKSRDGVMLYDGNMPISVSPQLGKVLYSDARAGAMGDVYYISMKDSQERWHMFSYDTKQSVWYREDRFRALGFGSVLDELYAIDEEHNTIVSIGGSMGDTEEDFSWTAEFGLFGTDYRGKKYMSRFDIRIYMEETSKAQLEIEYDSSGDWIKMPEIRGRKIKSFVIPVTPRRCDHLKFRLKGTGEMRIYSISRILEAGSDA